MDSMKRFIENANENEIYEIESCVKHRRTGLVAKEKGHEREKALETRICPEWLDAAVKEFRKNEAEYRSEGWLDDDDNDDLFHDILWDSRPKKLGVAMFYRVKHIGVTCNKPKGCWYDDNEDRVGEYEYSVYHAVDDNFCCCDVCYANLDKDDYKELIREEVYHFIPQLKEALK